jgi:phage-related protein
MADKTITVGIVTEGADKAAAELDKVAGASDRVDSSARKAGEGVQTFGEHSGDTSTALSTFAQAASAMGLDGLAAGLDTATVALDAVEGATILFRVATEAGILAQVSSKAAIILSTAATYAFAFASGIANTAQIIWTATTYALGVAFKFLMGPIGIIIAVVALLAAGIIYLWNNNETFRTVVTTVWNGIKAAIGSVVDWFQSTVIPMWQNLWDKAQGPLSWLRSTAGDVFDHIKAAIDPVIGAFQTLVGWVQSAIDWISRIHIPDLSSLNPFSSGPAPQTAGYALAGTIAGVPAVGVYGAGGWPAPTVFPATQPAAGQGRTTAGGVVVQVMVPPTANPVETGRQIVSMIRRYESAGSSAWRTA